MLDGWIAFLDKEKEREKNLSRRVKVINCNNVFINV
jgi:hypothetical protein